MKHNNKKYLYIKCKNIINKIIIVINKYYLIKNSFIEPFKCLGSLFWRRKWM